MTKLSVFVGNYNWTGSEFLKNPKNSPTKEPVTFLPCTRKEGITRKKPAKYLLVKIADGKPKYFSSLYPNGKDANSYIAEYEKTKFIIEKVTGGIVVKEKEVL